MKTELSELIDFAVQNLSKLEKSKHNFADKINSMNDMFKIMNLR